MLATYVYVYHLYREFTISYVIVDVCCFLQNAFPVNLATYQYVSKNLTILRNMLLRNP